MRGSRGAARGVHHPLTLPWASRGAQVPTAHRPPGPLRLQPPPPRHGRHGPLNQQSLTRTGQRQSRVATAARRATCRRRPRVDRAAALQHRRTRAIWRKLPSVAQRSRSNRSTLPLSAAPHGAEPVASTRRRRMLARTLPILRLIRPRLDRGHRRNLTAPRRRRPDRGGRQSWSAAGSQLPW